jgi:hypothetical protein
MAQDPVAKRVVRSRIGGYICGMIRNSAANQFSSLRLATRLLLPRRGR